MNDTGLNTTECSNNILTKTTITALWSILLIVSLLGNVLVVIAINKNKEKISGCDKCISSMCISDMIVPLVAIPFRIKMLYAGLFWLDGTFGAFLCKLVPLAIDTSTSVSIFSMIFIAIERYRGVLFATKTLQTTAKQSNLIITVIWIIAILSNSYYFYTFRLIHNNVGGVYCLSVWYEDISLNIEAVTIHVTVIFVFLYVLPILLLMFLYGAVICSLRRASRKLSAHLQRSITKKRQRQNNKITLMLIVVVIVFTLAYTPFIMILILSAYGIRIPCELQFITLFLFYSYTAINPVVYFAFMKRYSRNLRELLLCGKKSQQYYFTTRKRGKQLGSSLLHGQQESAFQQKQSVQTSLIPDKQESALELKQFV